MGKDVRFLNFGYEEDPPMGPPLAGERPLAGTAQGEPHAHVRPIAGALSVAVRGYLCGIRISVL